MSDSHISVPSVPWHEEEGIRDEGLSGKLRREAGLLPRVTFGPDGNKPYEPNDEETLDDSDTLSG